MLGLPSVIALSVFIAFLLKWQQRAAQKRRAHFVEGESWCETGKGGGLFKSGCLPMAPMLLVVPERRFRHVPFNGNYILRDLTRLRNKHNVSVWLAPEHAIPVSAASLRPTDTASQHH
jgi:hypothetical protein